MRTWKLLIRLSAAILVLVVASACGRTTPSPETAEPTPASPGDVEKLRVVATTNIVGDVVGNVGGDRIELTTLMELGVDPHSYVSSPTHTAAIHDAHVVFASGAGLEADLEEIFENAGGDAVKVHLSDVLELREAEEESEGEQGKATDEHGESDPHVWFDVQNVMRWVETIEETLSTLDPTHAEVYQANAAAYLGELEELDTWVMEQMATIPKANRRLVTNHPALGYLAGRYGLEQVGAVYPISPSSEPSAQDIAALEDAIREYGVPAVFTESTVNPKLAQQVAEDTGVKLVTLYTGSLGEPGSEAESYILLIRYDVGAIVEALK